MMKKLMLVLIATVMLVSISFAFRVTMGIPTTYRGYTYELIDCGYDPMAMNATYGTLFIHDANYTSIYNYTVHSLDIIRVGRPAYLTRDVVCGYTFSSKYVDFVPVMNISRVNMTTLLD